MSPGKARQQSRLRPRDQLLEAAERVARGWGLSAVTPRGESERWRVPAHALCCICSRQLMAHSVSEALSASGVLRSLKDTLTIEPVEEAEGSWRQDRACGA